MGTFEVSISSSVPFYRDSDSVFSWKVGVPVEGKGESGPACQSLYIFSIPEDKGLQMQ